MLPPKSECYSPPRVGGQEHVFDAELLEGRAAASIAAGETILSPWLPEASTASISEIERLDARH